MGLLLSMRARALLMLGAAEPVRLGGIKTNGVPRVTRRSRRLQEDYLEAQWT